VITIRQLDLVEYNIAWEAMRRFTEQRDENTHDEIWLLQHPAIFTQGQAGKAEHILNPGTIPVIQIDRGGQITYHGPGQLICYVLLNLKQRKLTIKQLINLLEQSVIDLLEQYGIKSDRRARAPGIYVDQAKIAALGLRVRKGCTFHGLALNMDMDLEPFSRINPCGFPDMRVTQLSDLIDSSRSISEASNDLSNILCEHLNYNFDQTHIKTSLPHY